jgi:ubiquinone biosynthesis protein UbiJ
MTTGQVSAAAIAVKDGVSKWALHLVYPGVAGVVVTILLAYTELLKSDPTAAGDLLKSWGPGFVLGLLAMVVIGVFLDKMVDAQRAGVDAQQKVAVALTQLAERDDRDRDRMVTETQYMAQRMDQTHALVTNVAAQLSRIEMKLTEKSRGE